MNEEWRAIPGFYGFYEASDQGRVRSIGRFVDQSNGPRWHMGKELRGAPTPAGHLQVHLSRVGRGRTYFVHRLVLTTFAGEPAPGEEGCHSNGNPADNRLSNLRWDTRSGNVQDAIRHGTYRNSMREKTHCKWGHELTSENTYTRPGTVYRQCRTCRRARDKRYADDAPGVDIKIRRLA